MHITITGTHIDVTDAIREYVHQKFSSISKYGGNDVNLRVEVELSKTTEHHAHGAMYHVEIKITKKGKVIHIDSIEDDLYKAIDEAKDKTARELSSYKDKQFSVFKRGAHIVKNLLKRGQ